MHNKRVISLGEAMAHSDDAEIMRLLSELATAAHNTDELANKLRKLDAALPQ